MFCTCSYLSFSIFYFLFGVWQGGWGCSVRAVLSAFLIFDKLFNIFTFWRPLSLTSLCLQVFISGKTSLVPSFKHNFCFQIFNFVWLWAGWLRVPSGSWFSWQLWFLSSLLSSKFTLPLYCVTASALDIQYEK